MRGVEQSSCQTPLMACATCDVMGERRSGIWKDSDPEWTGSHTDVPADVRARLEHVAGDEHSSARGHGLFRCRGCGAWFEWRRSYEFLIGGSEDEEEYVRVTPEHVATQWKR